MFQHLNHRGTRRKRGRTRVENLFEKIMENFPNLVKETDFQEVQEAQRVPKKLGPRKHTPRHIIITLPKIKVMERFLKAEREKETVKEGAGKKYSKSLKAGIYIQDYSI